MIVSVVTVLYYIIKFKFEVMQIAACNNASTHSLHRLIILFDSTEYHFSANKSLKTFLVSVQVLLYFFFRKFFITANYFPPIITNCPAVNLNFIKSFLQFAELGCSRSIQKPVHFSISWLYSSSWQKHFLLTFQNSLQEAILQL